MPVGLGQAAFGQLTPSVQLTSHAHEAPQSRFVQALLPVQVTSQAPAPQSMLVQVATPEHAIVHEAAWVQSTFVHELLREQSIVHA